VRRAAWQVGIARLHASWRAYLAIAVVLGITMGVSLFAIAGARRTESSYPRFLDAVHASTLALTSPGSYDEEFHRRVAAFPEVIASRTYVAFEGRVLRDGRPAFDEVFELVGTLDGRFFDQDRFTTTSGRSADPTRADEVMVNKVAAEALGYRVGQRITFGLYTGEQTESPTFLTDPPVPWRSVVVRIVAVGVFPDEVLQDDGDRLPRILVTPTLTRDITSSISYGQQGLVLRRGDDDIESFNRRVEALLPPGLSSSSVTSVTEFHAQQAIQPVVLALSLFGLITGIAGLVLTGQALSARRRTDRFDDDVLRALGASDRDLTNAALGPPLVVSVIGTLLACAIATALSPLMPVGAIRAVEVERGFSIDVTAFAVAIALIFLAPVLILAVRTGRGRGAGAVVPPAAVAHARPTLKIGVAQALRASDGTTGGGRVAVAGAGVAVAAVVAATTFGACLTHLTSSARLYGWDWDIAAIAGEGYGNLDETRLDATLAADADIDLYSEVHIGADAIDGVPVPLLGIAPDAELIPPITRGRMIRHSREIVLGAATAAALGKDVGDEVEVRSIGGGRVSDSLTVSGIATFPTIGRTKAERTSLGVGAIVVPERVPGWDLDLIGTQVADLGPNMVFIRLVDGASVDAASTRLRTRLAPVAGLAGVKVVGPQRPAEIVNARSIGGVPLVLGALLGAGAAVSLASAIAGSIRARRRELAVLKSLGFTPRQLASTVSWHATTIAVLGLAVGVPLGIIGGRMAWALFAAKLDVISEPAIPLSRLALLAAVAIVIANLAAAVPARRARRVEPALILRSE
jgi:hypothetical protein